MALVYDLKQDYLNMGFSAEAAAEFDSQHTIDSLAAVLNELGHEVEKIGHIKDLTKALAKGKRWDLVFNITEGAFGPSRESQVPALLEAWEIPYTFSDSLQMSICLHKGLTKSLVREAGFPTAPFHIIKDKAGIFCAELSFPLFAKPVFGGTSQGISKDSIIRTQAELKSTCETLLEKFAQPVLLEEYLPGREFTAGLVGTGDSTRSLGAMEIILTEKAEAGVYSYENKQYFEDRVIYQKATGKIGEEACELARKIWISLGLKDAGRIDLRQDKDGRLCFIEVNPLAGLNPEISDLPILCRLNGIDYKTLITGILDSARKRYGL
jgi:D-alanine-D-alanine ligase